MTMSSVSNHNFSSFKKYACILFNFLEDFCWVEPPVQCQTEEMGADILVLLLILGEKQVIFHYLVCCYVCGILVAIAVL